MSKSNPVKFSLDEPTDTQEFASGEVRVRGWAIPSAAPVSIAARVGNLAWVDVPHGKIRPDVATVHAGDPNATHSGFNTRIPVTDLQPGEYTFTLQIRSDGDVTSEVQRTVRIGDPSQSARESYISSPNDYLRIKLDDSSPGSVVLRDSVLTVVGWAVAKSEIDKVEIWLDSEGPYLAHYGLMREDIGPLYEDFPDASRSGFLWASQTRQLAPGTHSLKILGTSKTGLPAELNTYFELDRQSEYEHWSTLNKLDPRRRIDLLEKSDFFSYAPKLSIVTPVFKTPERFLAECVDSVKKQAYPKWELILVDDGSGDERLTEHLNRLAAGDRRILVKTLPSNLGIAGATNEGIDLCTGDFVAFLDHDDVLSLDALFSVAEALNQDPSIDVLYSDEDKLDENGKYRDGLFKPQWSPDLFLSMNYVCHLLVCRRSLLQDVGKLRLGFDGSQDYDLVLRISERTSKIHRIPKVLYHWRSHANSTATVEDQKPDASDAGMRALEEHLVRKGINAQVEQTYLCRYRVKYKIVGEPEVAIIIPTGGSPTLATALHSIITTTTYNNCRIIVVDNSRQGGVAETVAQFKAGRYPIQLLDCRNLPFNFSRLCNMAAWTTKSEHLLFLNDDTSIITPDWIESMLEHSQRESVGAVGCLLLFPNRTIQHAGVINGLYEMAGHCFRGLPDAPFYFGFSHAIRNCSAVTGACLMTRREVFESLGGFDEPNLPTCFQDVDLCLRILESGHQVVYTPFAKLFHYESFSKRAIAEWPELKYMKQRWASYIEDDPYYNPNLNRWAEDFSLKYDQVFLESKKKEQSGQLSPALFALRTASAKKLGRLGQIQFFANPEQSKTNARGLTRSTVFWEVTGIDKVQIRVGSPMGNVFTEGGPSGSATTGQWVSPGIVLYLLDASEGSSGSPDKVLSVLQL